VKKTHEELEKKTEILPKEKTELELLKEEVAEKNKAIEEQKNKYLRALADLDNFKKRSNLEKEEIFRFANEMLIKEILAVIDGFSKAIEFAGKGSTEELVKGIALVKKQLEDAMQKFGVEIVESVGKPYDPNFHEAILTKVSDQAPGVVLEEVQKGYILHGRLIRPAMVIVSKPHPLPT